MVRRPGEDAIEVEISDTQGHLRVDRARLIGLVRRVLAREGRHRASVSIALVDQATIQALNRAHLGHDWPTDVISFPLAGPDDPVLAGELVVCPEVAVAMARDLGVEPLEELALYIVHGLLHLCGYEDTEESDAAGMRRRQAEILAEVGPLSPSDRRGTPRDDRGGPTERPIRETRESEQWSV
jgi:probable rRNA maturation factor